MVERLLQRHLLDKKHGCPVDFDPDAVIVTKSNGGHFAIDAPWRRGRLGHRSNSVHRRRRQFSSFDTCGRNRYRWTVRCNLCESLDNAKHGLADAKLGSALRQSFESVEIN